MTRRMGGKVVLLTGGSSEIGSLISNLLRSGPKIELDADLR